MNLTDINVTQEHLRNPEQLLEMVEHAKNNNLFSLDAIKEHGEGNRHDLIKLNRFEDGKIFVTDGHHRLLSIGLSGRRIVDESEYEIYDWKYSDFQDIVFLKPSGEWLGWVTPFDVVDEVRLPDIGEFKEHVKYLYWNQSPQHAIHYIKTNKHLYAKKRSVNNWREFVFQSTLDTVEKVVIGIAQETI